MKKSEADKMSLQEICDFAITRIVEQGEPCLLDKSILINDCDSKCSYSSGDKHCAVGWLLDEDLFNDNDINLFTYMGSVYSLIVDYPQFLPDIIVDNKDLFTDLQGFHDSAASDNLNNNLDSAKYYLSEISEVVDTSGKVWEDWLDIIKRKNIMSDNNTSNDPAFPIPPDTVKASYIWCASNRTSAIYFHNEEDALKYAGSFGAAAGIDVNKIEVF